MMSQTLRGLSFVLLLALSPLARAETIGPLAPPGAPASAFPKPDRPVAEIISPIWATETERDAVKESEQIIAALGLEPGMSVADLGAGSGYHTVRLARALGPDGRVFAQDVMPKYLADLARRVRQEVDNVTSCAARPMTRACRRAQSTPRSWSTCTMRSRSPSPSCTTSSRL